MIYILWSWGNFNKRWLQGVNLNSGKNIIRCVDLNKIQVINSVGKSISIKIYQFIMNNNFRLENLFRIDSGFYGPGLIFDRNFYTEEMEIFTKKLNYDLKKKERIYLNDYLRVKNTGSTKEIRDEADRYIKDMYNTGIFEFKLHTGEILVNNEIIKFSGEEGQKFGYISKITSPGDKINYGDLKGQHKQIKLVNSLGGDGTFYLNRVVLFILKIKLLN